nr:phosphatase PAP2 family protein [Nocardioides daedukensis]
MVVFGLLWVDLVLDGPITRVDRWTADLVSPVTASPATTVAQWLSRAGAWEVSGALALGVAVALTLVRRSIEPVAVISGGLVLLAVLGFGTKTLIGRTGPVDPHADLGWGGAFPSGHSAAALVIACLLAILLTESGHPRNVGLAWITSTLWWLLIGWSRVQINVHWVGDVLSGWALGAVVVGIVCTTRRLVRKRVSRRGNTDR